MADKLIIGQLDPTSSCGNFCKHCGDSSLPNGQAMPLEDIEAIFTSGFFGISGVANSQMFALAGGGDPTAYVHGFVELIRLLSSFAPSILVLTGGVSRQLTLQQLRKVNTLCSTGVKINFTINHHPFGSNGHDARIKKTLLMFRDSGILGWTLRVRCIPEELAVHVDRAIKHTFPYMTRANFERSDLWRWINKKFGVIFMASPLKMYLGAASYNTTKPPLILEYNEDSLRCSGRALTLPRILLSGTTTTRNVEAMLALAPQLYVHPLRVTYDGFVTGCESSRFPRTDFFEGDLYGHNYDEIRSNRLLFIEHLISESRRWLRSHTSESGTICDTVCRRAREAFIDDPKRFPSHRGHGNTVLKARALVR
ncbi:MAG: hypothetical protein ABH842_02680 [Candidatus Micrarchaeota archaeon]